MKAVFQIRIPWRTWSNEEGVQKRIVLDANDNEAIIHISRD